MGNRMLWKYLDLSGRKVRRVQRNLWHVELQHVCSAPEMISVSTSSRAKEERHV
jgi:hypothetical protein